MSLSPKEIYCIERAAELKESFGLSWKQSYAKAEEEWKTTTASKSLNYDDDVTELEGYLE